MPTIEAQLRQYGDYLEELFEDGDLPAPVRHVGPRRGRGLLVAATVLLVALVAGLVAFDDGDAPVTATSGTIALVPPGMVPESASQVRNGTMSGFVAFGREDDPTEAVTVVIHPLGSIRPRDDAERTNVREHPARLYTSGHVRQLAWSTDDHDVLLNAVGIDDATLVHIAGELVVDANGHVTEARWLPGGWARQWDEGKPELETRYLVRDGDRTFEVRTWSGAPPGSLFGINQFLAEGRASVRGRAAFVAPPYLSWQEDDGLVVQVQGSEGDEPALAAFAESLVPVDVEAWTAFRRSVVPYVPTEGEPVEPAMVALDRLRAFAATPIQARFEQVPLAERVRLLDQHGTDRTVPRAELVEEVAWATVGHPTGALGLLVRAATFVGRPDRAGCPWNPPALPPPAGLGFDGFVLATTDDDGPAWFAVQVFARDGVIVAVRVLDEPC